jgi:UDP-N-acetylglucosamine enolpyruvyl transferase
MKSFGQVEHQLDHPLHRRASRDPLAMVGASRVVASGSLHQHRSVIVTHKEGGGMEVLISDIRSGRSVALTSTLGETRAELIARGHQCFDQKYEAP